MTIQINKTKFSKSNLNNSQDWIVQNGTKKIGQPQPQKNTMIITPPVFMIKNIYANSSAEYVINEAWNIYNNDKLTDIEKAEQLGALLNANSVYFSDYTPEEQAHIAEIKVYYYYLLAENAKATGEKDFANFNYSNSLSVANVLTGVIGSRLPVQDKNLSSLDITALNYESIKGIEFMKGYCLQNLNMTQVLKVQLEVLEQYLDNPVDKSKLAELKLYNYYNLGDYTNTIAFSKLLLYGDPSSLSPNDYILIGAHYSYLDESSLAGIEQITGLAYLNLGDINSLKIFLETVSIDTTELYTLMALKQLEIYNNTQQYLNAIILSAFLLDPTNLSLQSILPETDKVYINNTNLALVENGNTIVQTALEGSITAFLWDLYNSSDPSANDDLTASISIFESFFDLTAFSSNFKTNMAELKVYYYYRNKDYTNSLAISNLLLDNNSSSLNENDQYLLGADAQLLEDTNIESLQLMKSLCFLQLGDLTSLEIYLESISSNSSITELYTLMAMEQLDIYSDNNQYLDAIILSAFLLDPTNISLQNILSETDKVYINNTNLALVENGNKVVQTALEGNITAYLWSLYNSSDPSANDNLTASISIFESFFDLTTFSSNFKTNMAELKVYYYYRNKDYTNSLAISNLLLDNNSSSLNENDQYLIGADAKLLEDSNIQSIQLMKGLCFLQLGDLTSLETYLESLDDSADKTQLYTLLALQQLEIYSNSNDFKNAYYLSAFLSDPKNTDFQNALSTTDQLFIGNIDLSLVENGEEIVQTALEGSIIAYGWDIWENDKDQFQSYINDIESNFDIKSFSSEFQSNWADLKLMLQYL